MKDKELKNENALERYKNEIKATLTKLINNNELSEAKSIIYEYEKVCKEDADIVSMKSIILIMENKLDEAEKILKEALRIFINNSDLLFNLAYIYEIKSNYNDSIYFYKKARRNTNSEELKNNIDSILKNIIEKCGDNLSASFEDRKTSIVILTYNNLDYNKLCIESIRKYTEKDTYEIIVVDNNSTDGTVEWLKEQKNIKVILNTENNGFPKGCNQGIEAADIDNDIMLLNNDVIVTPNWLENLKYALYSEENIGAVGPVTNSISYHQAINVSYKTIGEMLDFAEKFNKMDKSKYEQRIKLVGFCLFIKREVINKVGLLDERFTPGNFEDDDYSFRILKEGYKLVLCKDTFIHHFGCSSFKKNFKKYQMLLEVNRAKFKEKWGFDSNYSCFIRNEIIDLIEKPKNQELNVLEIGCACGATLLKIKDIYPNANLYGIELDDSAALMAKKFANVTSENIEKSDLNYEEGFFDYIIFADVLEHLYDPWKVLRNMKKYLKKDGYILASIPNVMHYSVIKDLLSGFWSYEDAGILDRTHIRFFTLYEVEKMFTQLKYKDLQIFSKKFIFAADDESFISSLKIINANIDESQLKTYQYIVRAKN